MHRVKLCLNLSPSFGPSLEEQVRMLCQIGFDGFFVDWDDTLDVSALRKRANEGNMLFQSLHAPFLRIDRLWEPTDETPAVIDEQIRCLRSCADHDIPIMVAHTFIGFTKHTPTAQGLDNFSILVRHAEKLGVRIAFENTEGAEYLSSLMAHFHNDPAVGFCWDTGHELCYNRGEDQLTLYGDRLIATHFNDNLGVRDFDGTITFHDDLHLLPYDGVGDWDLWMQRLNRCHFAGPLTFELKTRSQVNRHENDGYARMLPIDFLTEAYKRACRVGAAFLRHS